MPDNADQQENRQQEQERPDVVRHENFESWYANNVTIHPSDWDLKLIFGELDWKGNQVLIQQHTAITLGWLQAKLLHHLMGVQIEIYELTRGKIAVPPDLWPALPQPPTGELANHPEAHRLYEYFKAARDRFIESVK